MNAHETPYAMARSLTTYIDDAKRVLAHVRAEFPYSKITLETVAGLREAHLRQCEQMRAGSLEARLCGLSNETLAKDERDGIGKASAMLIEAIRREHPEKIGGIPCL